MNSTIVMVPLLKRCSPHQRESFSPSLWIAVKRMKKRNHFFSLRYSEVTDSWFVVLSTFPPEIASKSTPSRS